MKPPRLFFNWTHWTLHLIVYFLGFFLLGCVSLQRPSFRQVPVSWPYGQADVELAKQKNGDAGLIYLTERNEKESFLIDGKFMTKNEVIVFLKERGFGAVTFRTFGGYGIVALTTAIFSFYLSSDARKGEDIAKMGLLLSPLLGIGIYSAMPKSLISLIKDYNTNCVSKKIRQTK